LLTGFCTVYPLKSPRTLQQETKYSVGTLFSKKFTVFSPGPANSGLYAVPSFQDSGI
jgi:hypothetical protein